MCNNDRPSYRVAGDQRNRQKSADEIINIVDQTWLTRYPWPQQVISDRGGEFKKEFARSLENDYGIKKKTITTKPPR